jgi:hypothetical protein
VLEESEDRADLVRALDDSLLGLRPTPAARLEPVSAIGSV